MPKLCPKCKITKPRVEFHRCSRESDGLQSSCKMCRAEKALVYNRSEDRRQSSARYKRSDKGRLSNACYKQTEKGKVAAARYKRSSAGKEAAARYRGTASYQLTEERFRKSSKCKNIKAHYKRTVKGKAAEARYKRAATGKAAAARYKQTEKAKASAARYNRTPHGKVNKAAHRVLRRAHELKATPAWADLTAIKEKYAEAARLTTDTGTVHHVDHEVPLRSKHVSGLHVHYNLQVLPGVENIRKGNRHWPDMP